MSDIAGHRLSPADYAEAFADLTPPLSRKTALVEASRCLFCYDAPCVEACPTGINIPRFIRGIQTDNVRGAATTILDANILGGTCARVCPTEILCEGACVRLDQDHEPVMIGALQRYATDFLFASGEQPFVRAPETGKRIAVVGAGPAGLACAHHLARLGHEVVIFERRPKGGGLNEYGIATYKTVGGFAQAEVDYVLSIGGIEVKNGLKLGRDFTLADLTANFDAVFLGMGLAGVNALGVDGENIPGVVDAVDFIAELRQAADKATVAVGRRVVVIGGGMTAIDAAVQAKLLGAEEVTICYRRGKEHMNASEFEQDLAASKGVMIRHWLQPKRVIARDGHVAGIEVEYTEMRDGRLVGTGEIGALAADQIFKAIGQTFEADGLGALALAGGRIVIDAEGRTSVANVWAGGDCVKAGEDLTVTSVAQGRDAADSINRMLAAAAQPAVAVA